MTLEQQLREEFSKAIERIEKLEKEVLQLRNKIVQLENQLSSRNLAAAVQDQASRRPQRTR
jgi:predicted  nucleic acid-binding Zn-ribbon protein